MEASFALDFYCESSLIFLKEKLGFIDNHKRKEDIMAKSMDKGVNKNNKPKLSVKEKKEKKKAKLAAKDSFSGI
jgi:hypothetical protein